MGLKINANVGSKRLEDFLQDLKKATGLDLNESNITLNVSVKSPKDVLQDLEKASGVDLNQTNITLNVSDEVGEGLPKVNVPEIDQRITNLESEVKKGDEHWDERVTDLEHGVRKEMKERIEALEKDLRLVKSAFSMLEDKAGERHIKQKHISE